MKINWGTGIALFYGTFVVVLVWVVIKSTTQDNSLVSDHYYADDLNYQQHYDKLANSRDLVQDLVIRENQELNRIELQFPGNIGKPGGEIHFFCPSDSKMDFKLPVSPDTSFLQVVPSQTLKRGLWKIKVDWQANGRTYFQEQTIAL